MGQGSDGDDIHPGFGHRAQGFARDAARRLGQRPSGYQFDRTAHGIAVHVIEHDNLRSRLDSLLHLGQIAGFDFDLESSTIAKPAEADVPPLDLSSINFDLETPDTQLGDDSPMSGMEQTAIPTHASAGMSLEGDLEHEVDTKLELARAYEEMGDQEGARELIDEILREGSPEQVARAQELAARLG